MKRFLFLCAIIFSGFTGWAQQTTCGQTLRLATSTYEQGRLHELEGILGNCLNNGFSKEEKVAALKLLTQAYIYLEEPQKADEKMLQLLQTDHYFRIDEAVDPAEFVALYKTFRTREIYRVGAKFGVNASQPNVTNTIAAVEINSDSKYKKSVAILFGGSVDVPISNRFDDRVTLHGELIYLQHKIAIEQTVDRGTNADGKPLTNKLIGFEYQSAVSLPLILEYSLIKDKRGSKEEKKFKPYVGMGIATDYLFNARLKAQRIRSDVTSIQETTFDLTREKVSLSGIITTGIKTQVGAGYFVAEVRYQQGITKVNSAETAYANQRALWEQGYADSVYRLNYISISASYLVNIFNPKKKSVKGK